MGIFQYDSSLGVLLRAQLLRRKVEQSGWIMQFLGEGNLSQVNDFFGGEVELHETN